MGWFGLSAHVQHVLATLGADRDDAGHYLVHGGLFVGIDPSEVVIDEDAVYFVNGQPRSLAAAMNGTSYGVRNIHVI